MILQEMVRDSIDLLDSDPRHDLRIGVRDRILCALGRNARVRLDIASIAKVLPLWEEMRPADRTPHSAIEFARQVDQGLIRATQARRECDALRSCCDKLLGELEDRPSVCMIAYGAAQTVRDAMSDERFVNRLVWPHSTDLDIQPFDNDPSFFAAVAYAKGAPWEEGSDALARHEFWKWWLATGLREASAELVTADFVPSHSIV
jgi:hypothetical protein